MGLLPSGKASYYPTTFSNDDASYQLPNQGADRTMYQDALAQAGAYQTPVAQAAQAAGPDLGQQDAMRQGQLGLIGQLQAQANGQGPSLAQMQLQRANDQAIAAQRAQAASARGVPPALAQRMAAQNIAGLTGQNANDSAMLRMQEQMNAQGMLGGVLNGARGQDLGVAGLGQSLNLANAGFNQQTNLANQQADLSAQGIRNQASQYAMSGITGMDATQLGANETLDQNRQNAFYNAEQLQLQRALGNAANNPGMQLAGAALSAGGTLGAAAMIGKH